MSVLIGIDPGWSGGFAFRYPDGEILVDPMPKDQKPSSVYFLLKDRLEDMPGVAWLEHVWAMPTNGSKANFSMGQNLGVLEASLSYLHVLVRKVTPQKWMNRLDLPHGAANKTARKRKIKELMGEKYGVKLTNATADALGVLDWALEVGERE